MNNVEVDKFLKEIEDEIEVKEILESLVKQIESTCSVMSNNSFENQRGKTPPPIDFFSHI